MGQAKAISNLNEGVIQLKGPVEFVRRYLEQYAPAIKGLPSAKPKACTTTSGFNRCTASGVVAGGLPSVRSPGIR